MSNLKDLTNKKFGYLTVIKRAPDHIQSNGRHRTKWVCKCQCGNKTIVGTDQLVGNRTRSCGCYHIKRATEANIKHNMAETRIYRIWHNVKTRCFNKNSPRYKDYGARGIRICNEWLDFKTFYRDMSESYNKHCKKYGEKNTTLDRKNNNKNYCKENCKWSTFKEQANNKRDTHYITFNGETLSIAQMARKYSIPSGTLYRRINDGWKVEKAMTKPLKHRKSSCTI
jgi:hypothetical protein